MKRLFALLIAACLLLSGCESVWDGNYSAVKPHEEDNSVEQSDDISASSYSGLLRALEKIIEGGREKAVISVANYNQLVVARDMDKAVEETMVQFPLGVYAVENIQFELGTNAGRPAIAVEISYLHDYADIKNVQYVKKMDDAKSAIAAALENFEPGIVLHISAYEERDLSQWVEDHAQRNPDKIMELPQVTVNYYPETGSERVLEIKFAYQSSRDTLRSLQQQVGEAFEEALSLAEAEESEQRRYEVLYTYLTTRAENYKLETSLTPTYSLLMHGVGDAYAVSTVFAALCRQAGLTCIIVTGTRDGQAHRWNIVRLGETYYHLDILASMANYSYGLHSDSAMQGYVWDYSAYPACGE